MKRFIVMALCFCASLCYSDVRIAGGANYQIVGRGLTWAAGINNNFILDSISPSIGACITVTNNDSINTHAFALTVFATTDVQTTCWTGCQSRYVSAPVTTAFVSPIAASSTAEFYANIIGSAHYVIVITGGAGVSSADVLVSQTGGLCGTGSPTPVVNTSAVLCNKSATVSIATATTNTTVAAPGAGLFIHVCAYTVTEFGPTTANNTIFFSDGTVGTCAATAATEWAIDETTATSFPYELGAGIGQLFQTTTAAQPLCIRNGGVGVTVQVSISYVIQ